MSTIRRVKLTKLPLMGIKVHPDKFDFEWPKADHNGRVEQLLHLQGMARLTQIKLKGVTSLEGIQFILDSGTITSPFICPADNEPVSSQSTQLDSNINTYDIDSSRHIKTIKVTIDRHVLITGLELLYDDGGVAMSHKFDSKGLTFN